MSPSPVDWSELTKEKSLAEIYFLSRRIPHSRFNTIVCIVSGLILTVFAYNSTDPPAQLKAVLLKWAETGLGFALNILGFLMAGFTIFATLSKPNLLLEMQKHTEDASGLSYLKYNFFVFVRVFVHYLTFAVGCVLLLVLGSMNGLAPRLLMKLPAPDVSTLILLKGSIVIVGVSLVYLLLSLKSFLFNIYHVVMTTLRWEAENQPEREDSNENH